ncbi:hypothetical protein HMPREF9943_00597 [Eggerthia catenaformis OT 569 = DSM 20559]|uniref:NlpC/P60 domain-containing protein n=1 Tax=Eggerthia catenaformis OT 569 = DSM 20559 TaxID=999415 RepID=M2PN84_9FIRM|nr:C40 family peptidase [Eggerthia catenaformis]EMD17034.1 hypothetical protein HMPREF9943_00597 [Eggerthia catenaformis OT 569 = DSM 20559]OUC51272.1 hypothetical protein B7939_06820 [Eggerthia catenaformis]
MNKRKLIALTLAFALQVPILSGSLNTSKASKYEGQENKYYKLCSSKKLSASGQKECKKFNAYLQQKSKDIKSDISKTKSDISDTKSSISDIGNKIISLENDIDSAQIKINYIKSAIEVTKSQIADKQKQLKERIYSMQSELNSTIAFDYLFSAKSFTDFFSRAATLGDITAYENELMNEIKEKQNDLTNQKKTLSDTQAILVAKKDESVSLRKTLNAKLAQQNSDLSSSNKELDRNNDNIDDITKNLAALKKASEESKVTAKVTVKVPKKKVTKTKPSSSANNSNVSQNGVDKSKVTSEEVTEEVPDTGNIGYKIAQTALKKKGSRYIWGHQGPTTFDCSGLVYWACKQNGVSGSRTTTKVLANRGRYVSKGDLQPGDIILFSSNGKHSGVHHVGIYIGDNMMVHAADEDHGVIVSRITTPYWIREYYNARRLY